VVYTSIWMMFLSVVLTPFYNFFFVLWNQLRPVFKFNYYMVCVPCCCGCFCTDNWLRWCVPKKCRGDFGFRNSTWLIVGMSFVWIVCTVVLNDNECLAESAIIEYAFGFRGAATLVLLFAVLINIELTYNGEVKGRNSARNQRRNDPQSLRRNPNVNPNNTRNNTGNNTGNSDVNEQQESIEMDLQVNGPGKGSVDESVQGNHTESVKSEKTTVR